MNKLLRYLSIIIFAVSKCNPAPAQTAPQAYYTFDLANPLAPVIGATNLSGGGAYTIQSGGQVGKYIQWLTSADYLNGPTINTSFQATVQFWFKSEYGTFKVRNSQVFNWFYMNLSFEYPFINFSAGNPTLSVKLDGIGRKSWGYWMDGNWHHVACVVNLSSGRMELWIDGQLPTGFSQTVPSGSMLTGLFRMNQTVNYTYYLGDLDEVAIYTTALDPRQIYQNYVDGKAGNHYTTAFAASVPPPDNVTGVKIATDYAPGTNIGSVPVTTGVTLTPLQQLQAFPIPRYKPTNTLLKLWNNADPDYEGQRFQPGVSDAQAGINAGNVALQFAKDYNMGIAISGGPGFGPTTSAANNNIQYEMHFTILRAQIPGGPALQQQGYTADRYLQNNSGGFIDGTATSPPFGNYKLWRPTGTETFYSSDGNTQKNFVSSVINTQTNRPSNKKADRIFENAEVFNCVSNYALSLDPRCRDSIATYVTPSDTQGWYGYRLARNENVSYLDVIRTLPGVALTKFSEYNFDGHPHGQAPGSNNTLPYRFKWLTARKVNSLINNQYYSTPDIYVIRPELWYIESVGATVDGRTGLNHGFPWLQQCRPPELAAGDSLCSPFAAAGWYADETINCRMAQMLTIYKVMGPMGAETFYPSFFSLGAPYPNAANWIWQLTPAAYAQALTSRYENILRGGGVLSGDVPYSYVTNEVGYRFYSGDNRILTTIRKKYSGNQYIIATGIMPLSNIDDTSLYQKNIIITLNSQVLTITSRKQGSVYYYDASASPVIFYQLDKWHERYHPSWWSANFDAEAEVYDTASSGITIATVRPSSAAAGDFTNYTSYIKFAGVDSVEYNFQPRTVTTQYLYVRARSSDGTSTGFNQRIDGAGVKTINCITDTNWLWYRFNTADGSPITFSSLSAANHTLRFTSTNGKLWIDRIVVSSSNNLFPSAWITCGAPTATITPSGATTFCQGGSVTLTANSSNAYLWSTGASTQAIVVTTSGTYTVTITITGSGTASASQVVTVLPLPTATITPSGPTTFCNGQSVNLTASSNSSYLWSTGAVTQVITASTSGDYTVTVTGANGCTKVSAGVTVTVNPVPAPTITAGGSTTFCTGGSVTLSTPAVTGNAYQWKRNNVNIAGATLRTYTATLAGDYYVQVVNAGCSANSNVITVTPVALPTTANAGADQSVCTDSTALTGNAPVNGTGLWTLVSGAGTLTLATSPTSAVTSLGAGANVFKWTIANTPCTASSDNVTITQTGTSPVSITIFASAINFCSGATIVFTAIPINGGNPTFQWKKNGVNVGSNSPSYSTAGVNGDQIQCVLTSDLICATGSPATSNTITLSLSSVSAAITAGGPVTFCNGGSVTLSANTGSGLTYQWRLGGINQIGAVASTFSATVSGDYDVVVTNSNGCTAVSNSITVTVNSSPTATITPSGSTTVCFADSVELTASSATSYLWSNGATTQSIYAKSAGNYFVTVSNGSCTATSAGISISIRPKFNVSIDPASATICTGDSILLNPTNGVSYLWSTGDTVKQIYATVAGVYYCTITNGNGCTASASCAIVEINCDQCVPPPSASAIAKEVSVKIDWSTIPAARDYILTLTNDQSHVVKDFTFNSSSAFITKLNKSTQYHFQIKSLCGTTFSDYSRVFFFRTTK